MNQNYIEKLTDLGEDRRERSDSLNTRNGEEEEEDSLTRKSNKKQDGVYAGEEEEERFSDKDKSEANEREKRESHGVVL